MFHICYRWIVINNGWNFIEINPYIWILAIPILYSHNKSVLFCLNGMMQMYVRQHDKQNLS